MTIEEAIQRAIEGGWYAQPGTFYRPKGYPHTANEMNLSSIFLDPLFWQALGKAMRWKTIADIGRGPHIRSDTQPEWLYHWHSFIDHLAEGKSAESFFQELT